MSISLIILLWVCMAIGYLAQAARNGHTLTLGDVLSVFFIGPAVPPYGIYLSIKKHWNRVLWRRK